MLLANATNRVGLAATGYWRLWSSSETPELIIMQDDLVPGGTIRFFDGNAALNATKAHQFYRAERLP